MSRRSSAVGRSMKKSSSNRPRRRSSEGSMETSFAVATTKTGLRHSCSQKRNCPTMRVETPPSFELPAPESPFSISSIQRMHGATFSAVWSALWSCCSVCPT